MAQNNVDYSYNPTGPDLLDDYLAKEQENLLTSNSGIQRPSYANTGTLWLDNSSNIWSLNIYDGLEDVLIGGIDSTTHSFTVNGVDESNFVHKNESETITGDITFYKSSSGGNLLQSTGSTISGSYVDFIQQINGARRGTMRTMYNSDGSYAVIFGCNGVNADAPQGITVTRDTFDNISVRVPNSTQTTSTSSRDVATVGWVNSANNNVVHKTGVETIGGVKTFQGTGWITYIKNTSVTYNTAPSSDTTTAIAFVDKNSQNMGIVECFRLTDNSTMMQFNIYGRNGSWATRPLEFKILSNGKEVAFAPASDVINSIVTTTAIHKATNKGSFKLGNGMIVNYGAQQMTKNSTTVITFDTPFTGDYTYGLSTGYKSSISRDDPITISERTSTNFTARNTARDGNDVTCIYLAIGY